MYTNIIYRNVPPILQSTLISIRAGARSMLREGRTFAKMLADAEQSQWLDKHGLERLHRDSLRALLIHAVTQVPFYRAMDISPQLVAADPQGTLLSQFPLLDKATIRGAGSHLLAEKRSHSIFKGSTSGTTGSPLTLAQDLRAINRENAFVMRQLGWAGFRPGDRRVWLRGDLVVSASEAHPPFWRSNYAERMRMFSSYHLSEKSASSYIRAISEFDPVIIQAYPSSITFLAKWLDANNIAYPGSALKGIVTSSETIDAGQKALIEARFRCSVFDWYGQLERVAAIGTCEHGHQHLVSDYSFVEFLPVNDGLFEIVGTGLNNFVMPLIRYRTGDYVRLDDATSKCACGRHFPLVASIYGRTDDVVKLPDGRRIGRLDHIFKGINGILEAQILQNQVDCIDILVVPTVGYSPAVEAKLRANAHERLGPSVRINVQPVGAIARTKNGKLRGVICNVE